MPCPPPQSRGEPTRGAPRDAQPGDPYTYLDGLGHPSPPPEAAQGSLSWTCGLPCPGLACHRTVLAGPLPTTRARSTHSLPLTSQFTPCPSTPACSHPACILSRVVLLSDPISASKSRCTVRLGLWLQLLHGSPATRDLEPFPTLAGHVHQIPSPAQAKARARLPQSVRVSLRRDPNS